MNSSTDACAVFPLLADPTGYRPCLWDLLESSETRNHWLELFRSHFPKLLSAYRAEADERGEDAEAIEHRVADAHDRFMSHLDIWGQEPAAFGPLNVLGICLARERALRVAGIEDPYRLAKQTDTDHALEALPALLAELDAMAQDDRQVAVIQGVFAGNIYDLGATKTVEMFTDQRVDFHAVREQLKPRPWRFDGLDAWLERLKGPAHQAAVLFVDNAGPDVTLGMLPFARELLRRGTAVILASNTSPSLNDITHDELVVLVDRIVEFDPLLAGALSAGQLTLVASGNEAPLIDLSRVSRELAQAVTAAGVDLVVLEGMGRAVESNLDAVFACDSLKLAMLKDEGVAKAVGGEVFDLVMQYEPALDSAPRPGGRG